jgi:hypothetical protein
MPSILSVLAGILIGADTGLLMRRTPQGGGSAQAPTPFPALFVAAALLAGIALAEAALLAVLEHYPEFASYIAGPLLAAYGFFWFQGGMLEHRLRPVRVKAARPAEETSMPAQGTLLQAQIRLGIRMGLLLCAAGTRTIAPLTLSIVTAIVVATAAPESLRSFSPARVPVSIVVRTATGALLFAIGIGTEIERLTGGAVPSLQIALPLTLLAWGACALTLWRSPNP